MRFRTRRHGAWFLALFSALSGCAPLTQLPGPPQGPVADPEARSPQAAPPPDTAPALPPEPVVAPPKADYQPVEAAPEKRKKKRDRDDHTWFFEDREDD